MTPRAVTTRVYATVVAVCLVAAACGSGSGEEVATLDGPDQPVATPTVDPPEPTPTVAAPRSSTAQDLIDRATEDTQYQRYQAVIAATDPLPPDGGQLIDCAEVPELESSVGGTLGGRQNLDNDVSGVLTTYWMEHLETFGGMWIDRANGGAIVLAFTDDPAAHKEAILARAPSADDYPAVIPRQPIADDRPLGERDDVVIDTVQVRFTEAQLRATQNAIGEYMGDTYGLMSSNGGTTKNRIELGFVDPPDGALDALAPLLPTAAVCITVTRTPEPPSGPLDVIPDLDAEDPLVTCRGTPPVPYSTLVNPPSIDDVDHPAVDALITELAQESVEALPEGDWVVLSIDEDLAVFAALSDDGFGRAAFERRGDSWILAGWGSGGEGCDAVVALPEGLGRSRSASTPTRYRTPTSRPSACW